MSNYENFNRDVSLIYFFLNSAGSVLMINPLGAICLGYTIDESIGQPIFNLFWFFRAFGEAAQSRYPPVLLEVLQKGTAQSGSIEFP